MMLISKPTLLLNEHIIRQNMERMAQKAARHGLVLKPHVKTHQSITVGKWMRDYGVKKITVSSVKMAEYFARVGWDDITIAFPCNPLQAERLNHLAAEITLSILISDETAFSVLASKLNRSFQVYIEIDTGANRTGFQAAQIKPLQKLAQELADSEQFNFRGFYSHPGHSYKCRSEAEIQAVHHDVVTQMQRLRDHFENEFPRLKICTGDTPCCSIADNFEGIDEISPGNFVFYDLMQQQIGACAESDIGIALACPVVAKYPGRNEIAVHGGAVHLSKEKLNHEHGPFYGKIVWLDDGGFWQKSLRGCYLKSISQEHGIVQCSPNFFNKINVGDVIGILPVHSCLTADVMQEYTAVKSGNKIDHMR